MEGHRGGTETLPFRLSEGALFRLSEQVAKKSDRDNPRCRARATIPVVLASIQPIPEASG